MISVRIWSKIYHLSLTAMPRCAVNINISYIISQLITQYLSKPVAQIKSYE